MELTGYRREDVHLHDWDPESPRVFEFLRERIGQVLPGMPVEHIGSSSVPGLPGKNYVDVMVLPPIADLAGAVTAIDRLGLEHARGFRPERPFFVGAVRHDSRVTNVHLYVIPADADEALTQHGFAQALRDDPALRDAYAAVKRQALDSGASDPVRYSMRKAGWVVRAVERLGLPPLPDPGPPPPEYLEDSRQAGHSSKFQGPLSIDGP